jgi:uracil-DNA glycosylase
MTARRLAYLTEMGLAPVWRLAPGAGRGESATQIACVPGNVVPSDSRESAIAQLDWAGLQETVAGCRACRLCEARKQAVLGVGDKSAEWMFVGEGPGAEEDERGEPFVGQAGKLLDNMLAAIGLNRATGVYIANAVKCRPPGNRNPETDEMAACFPFLQRQIGLVRPRLLVALGRVGAVSLLGSEVKIGAARGKVLEYNGIPVVVTYHPAYLLRNLPDKAKAWEDLLFAQDTLAGTASR